MKKAAIVEAIVEAIRRDFDALRDTSKRTRAAGNDEESKSEGKYDTRSTEDNYLADGLARQALAAAEAGAEYEDFPLKAMENGRVDVGALVEVEFAKKERVWFFLGPAGGGTEVNCEGVIITVLTGESPLGRELMGLKAGDVTSGVKARVLAVE